MGSWRIGAVEFWSECRSINPLTCRYSFGPLYYTQQEEHAEVKEVQAAESFAEASSLVAAEGF